MVLAGIDYWHQELTLVDAKEGTVVEVAKEGMKTRGANIMLPMVKFHGARKV